MKKILLPLLFIPLLFSFSNKTAILAESFSLELVTINLNDSEHPFLDLWVDFRNKHPKVCDISKEDFKEIYAAYLVLSNEEKAYVNAQGDVEEGYTIGQIMRTLVNMHYPNNNKVKEEKKKLEQSSIIVIAIVVALVGASAISVLYILKNNKVIK